MEQCNPLFPINPMLVIPTAFEECFTYYEQILWLKQQIDNIETGGDVSGLDELNQRVTALEKLTQDQDNDISEIEDEIKTLKELLDAKQGRLTFDQAPTEGSDNPVTSGGVFEELSGIDAKLETLMEHDAKTDEHLATVNERLTSVTDETNRLTDDMNDKQDKLTFDTIPTEGSYNPVTSNGIREAIDSIPGVGAMSNPITSATSNTGSPLDVTWTPINDKLGVAQIVKVTDDPLRTVSISFGPNQLNFISINVDSGYFTSLTYPVEMNHVICPVSTEALNRLGIGPISSITIDNLYTALYESNDPSTSFLAKRIRLTCQDLNIDEYSLPTVFPDLIGGESYPPNQNITSVIEKLVITMVIGLKV